MTSNGINGDLSEVASLSRDSDTSSFPAMMDLKIVESHRGYALAEVTISPEKHLNFRGRTHGAVIFAVADHACGVCGNSLGREAVLIHSSINYFASPKPGTVVRAEARMAHVGKTSGTMVIEVKTSDAEPLARLQAIVLFLH